MKIHKWLFGIILILTFITGVGVGGFLAYEEMQKGIVTILSNMRIEKVEVGFNETYIMDRFEQIANQTKLESKKAVDTK